MLSKCIALLLLFSSLEGKIYDCFIFYNELEILMIRLHELYDVVDHFVLVESKVSFRGEHKECFFQKNREKFAQFNDKIIYVQLDDPAPGGSAWDREHSSRNALLQGLTQCAWNDIVIISDVDEILPATSVKYYSKILTRDSKRSYTFNQRQHEFFLNRVSPNREHPETYRYIVGPVMFSYENCCKYTPQGARHARMQGCFTLVDAGWHFTSMGGFMRVVDKTNSYAFWDEWQWEDRRPFSEEERARFEERVNLCHYLPIDGSYPRFIQEHQEELIALGFIEAEL